MKSTHFSSHISYILVFCQKISIAYIDFKGNLINFSIVSVRHSWIWFFSFNLFREDKSSNIDKTQRMQLQVNGLESESAPKAFFILIKAYKTQAKLVHSLVTHPVQIVTASLVDAEDWIINT